MSKFVGDPVVQEDGAWWFWDETWTFRDGPFQTEEAARDALRDYFARGLGDEDG